MEDFKLSQWLPFLDDDNGDASHITDTVIVMVNHLQNKF
jgi:hypothetical protein